MSKCEKQKDTRKAIRSEQSARDAMWTHYNDNRNLYIDEIREFRDDILYEIAREPDVVVVFSKYKKIISRVA